MDLCHLLFFKVLLCYTTTQLETKTRRPRRRSRVDLNFFLKDWPDATTGTNGERVEGLCPALGHNRLTKKYIKYIILLILDTY